MNAFPETAGFMERFPCVVTDIQVSDEISYLKQVDQER